ncbi:MAG: hypothetical protein QOJ81_2235 [Chloroflexota bacterium]|nr:hypothetical protein [Chloroflexota bacterium]
MGQVFRAHDERLDREVAIKILSPALSDDESFRQRFQRESRVAAAFHHPNIVPVFDAGEWEGQLYIAMMLVQGPNLAAVIARDAPMALRRVVGIVSQVASALDAAHSAGTVHRDVKPANILLLERPAAGRPEHAYLVDFGLTRSTSAMTQMTRVGSFVGTLDYVAPEQLQGDQIDGRADQYALACTAYQMLAGAPPFKRESEVALISAHLYTPPPMLSAVRHDLPESVSWVLTRAMAKEPEARFRTTEEFADALSQAAAGAFVQRQTLAAGTVPPAARGFVRNDRPYNSGRSYRSLSIGLGVVFLALIVGLGAVAGLALSARPGPTDRPTQSPPAIANPGTGVVSTSPAELPTLIPTQTPLATFPVVTAPPFPWQIFIAATPSTTLEAGTQVTIHVTLNGPFADATAAGLVTQVYSSETGKVFSCLLDSAAGCSFKGAWDDFHVTTYVATIGPAGGPTTSQDQVQVTWLAATPAPTAPSVPGAPLLASGTWVVLHTYDHFEYGSTDHYEYQVPRDYSLTYYECVNASDCTAAFYVSGADHTFLWDGYTWVTGPTNYVTGRKCGDVPGGYDVDQTVSVYPTAWDSYGRITEMQGEMVLTGYATDTGYYYGCSDYQIVYSTVMTAR